MNDASSSAAWAQFSKNALLWFIPALLVLPFYLILLAISLVAGDGTLLEMTEGVKGGINCALGPLLILVGVAAAVVSLVLGSEAIDYIEGIFFAVVSVGLGVVLARRALTALR